MVAIVALIIWRLNPSLVFAVFIVFAALDGVYLSAVLTKIPQGAWFTLVLACVLSSIFILWRFGKENQWRAEASDRFQPSHLVTRTEDGKLQLTAAFGGGFLTNIKGTLYISTEPHIPTTLSSWPIYPVPHYRTSEANLLPPSTGFGIFFDKAGDMTPTVFIQFLSKFVVTPRISVFFHLRPLCTPSVPPENRYTVLRTVIPNCYRLIIRHGYTDEVVTEDLGLLVYEQLRNFIIREGGTGVGGNGDGGKGHNGGEGSSTDPSSSSNPESSASSTRTPGDRLGGREIDGAGGVAGRLAETQRAYETQVLYIVGKEQMRIRSGTRIWRRVALNAFLWLRDNTRSKMASMRIPTDSLVEVGFIKEI